MKVFVVDDDHLSIFLTQTVLELENVAQSITSFMCASDALEALQNCSQEHVPDVIFLDLNMPLMDGWLFLDELASLQEKLRRCKIYILTSSLDTSDTARVKAYPIVSGFLLKPISIEDIHLIASAYRASL